MTTPQPDRDRAVRKLGELIADVRIGMLTTVTADGGLWGRPLLTRAAPFDGDLWFVTRLGSAKLREVRARPRVSVTYSHPGKNAYASVSGTAEVVSDPGRARAWWDPSYERWLPGGPDDPDLALIRVRVERAEYWVAPALTWPAVAGFVVTAPEQADDPEYHARIAFPAG